MHNGLQPPKNIVINISPSERQYELWKSLQPDYCPYCGGHIIQKRIGQDKNGNPQYKPCCDTCGTVNLPQIILGGGAAGGGKMCPLDSNVCTPFGFRKVKDLKVGDIISSATTGRQQRIMWLHPIEEHEFYRVHFIDGTYTDCSEGHLWQLHQSRKQSKKKDLDGNMCNERVWPAAKIYAWMQNKKNGMYKGSNLIIPLCKPVQFTMSSLIKHPKPIAPYILGALIGDGRMTNTVISHGYVELTTMDDEIVSMFKSHGYDMSKKSRKPYGKAANYHIYDNRLISGITDIELAGHDARDKFIPLQYKYSSIEERKELMRGLMDTDGYVDDRGHMSYSTISKQLADDVAFVVRSLGGIATIKQNTAGYKGKDGEFVQCNDIYDVYIRTAIDPELVSITRKKERCRYEFNGGNSELGKRIIDIEPIGKKVGRCITVDEPCGLYIADNFTVTHNSYLGSCWLISSCIRFENIRAVVARKTLKSLKESTWNTIKMIMKDWGLVEGENYKINNLEGTMTFWNDSAIIMKEMAELPSSPNYDRFGSSEYTIAFVDECSEISEKAIEVLFSRLRWKVHETFKYPRMLMSTNPCINWVRSRFVQDDDGNPIVCREGEKYIPFSVFDNPNEQFRQTYEAALNKITDKATRERLLYGNWDFIDSNDMAAYWNFNGAVHLVTGLKEKVYTPLKPLISSWDFNVSPFMSTISLQIDYDNQKVYILEEILGKPAKKENNTPALAKVISNKYLKEQHAGGLIITGDPAGLARSTQTEDGVNNYTIIIDNISNSLNPKKKLLTRQPSQITRLEFVNSLFNGYDGWEILIDMRCRRLAEDLVYQTKNDDGTKSKKKVLDPKTGVKYEKYGHLSDCLDYALCMFLSSSWNKFQRKKSIVETTDLPVYGSFSY